MDTVKHYLRKQLCPPPAAVIDKWSKYIDSEAVLRSHQRTADAELLVKYLTAQSKMYSEQTAADAKLLMEHLSAQSRLFSQQRAADANLLVEHLSAHSKVLDQHLHARTTLISSFTGHEPLEADLVDAFHSIVREFLEYISTWLYSQQKHIPIVIAVLYGLMM